MRSLVGIVTLWLLSMGAAAGQGYKPMLRNTTFCVYGQVWGVPDDFWVQYSGDTIIQSVTYKIYRQFSVPGSTYLTYYAREDSIQQKVWQRSSSQPGAPELLWYDLAAPVGTRFSYGQIISISTLMIGGQMRKVQCYGFGGQSNGCIIEGFGSGQLGMFGGVMPVEGTYDYSCIFRDSTLVYTNPSPNSTCPGLPVLGVEEPETRIWTGLEVVPVGEQDLKVHWAGEGILTLQLFNASGSQVRSLTGSGSPDAVISLSGLPVGLYILRTTSLNGRTAARKFIR